MIPRCQSSRMGLQRVSGGEMGGEGLRQRRGAPVCVHVWKVPHAVHSSQLSFVTLELCDIRQIA